MHSRTTTSVLALAGIALLLTSCGGPDTPEDAAKDLMKKYGKAVSSGDKNALIEMNCANSLSRMEHADFSSDDDLPKYSFKPIGELEGIADGFQIEAEETVDGEDGGTIYFYFEKNASDEWCIAAVD